MEKIIKHFRKMLPTFGLATYVRMTCSRKVQIFNCLFSSFLLGDGTPSPNSYTLPALLGPRVPSKNSSASYSMTARAKTGGFSEDLAKTPGPGRYRTVDPSVTKRKDPCYSMLTRNFMPGGTLLEMFFFVLCGVERLSGRSVKNEIDLPHMIQDTNVSISRRNQHPSDIPKASDV